MSDFVSQLRRELVDAAEREQERRLPRVPQFAPRTLLLAATATAAAALIVVLAVGGLRIDSDRARTPAGQPKSQTRELFGGSLESGVRYETRRLIPTLSFVVPGDNWETFEAASEDTLGLDLRRTEMRGGLRFESPPIGLLLIQRVAQVYDPSVQGRQRSLVPAPADLYAWLREHPDLRVGPQRQVTVAGMPGTSFAAEVRFDRPAHAGPGCYRRSLRLCTALAPNAFWFNGDHLRMTILDTGSGPLVITVGAETAAGAQKVAKAAEPLLATLRIDR